MSNRARIPRREFLRRTRNTSLGVATGLALPNLFLNRTKAATGENPSEFVRIGFIGLGGQGNSNLGGLMKHAVAVCDMDRKHLAAAQARVEKANHRPCAAYGDFRKLLEDKSIDAVLSATPDHWHVPAALAACEAGKDVYSEKPLTLSIHEGRVLVNAVRRHRRVLQTGSQQRSDTKFRKGCELVRSGYIGKVHTVRVGLPGVNWMKDPPVPDSAPPLELNYDFWLGPAPERPYNAHRVHYYFRFFWDYSGGQMTNWGAHHLDIAQWGLGMDDSGPVEIAGTAEYNQDHLYEVPQSFRVTYKYANGVTMYCESPAKETGTRFIGDKGSIHLNRGVLESDPEDIVQQASKPDDVHLYASREHHQNWLDCIKSRHPPICDVEIGHRSASVCHLGNIALRTGRRIQWNPAKEEIVGDAVSVKELDYEYRKPWKLAKEYAVDQRHHVFSRG